MPEGLASARAGQAVDVVVLPEVSAGPRRLHLNGLPDGLPFLMGDDGIAWNGYRTLPDTPSVATVPSPVMVGFGGIPIISEAARFFVMSSPMSKVTLTLLLTVALALRMGCLLAAMVAPG